MDYKFIDPTLAEVNHCPLHWHDSIELIAVVEGSIRVKDGFEEHYLNQGDVIVINRGDLHAIYSTAESNLIIILDIDIKYFEDKYSNIKDTIIVCDSNTDKAMYAKQLDLLFLSALNLYNHCFYSEYSTVDEIETQTVNLLELLINNFRHLRIFEDKFISLGCNNDHAKTLGDIMDYIYNNFSKDISLDDISKVMNFSKYYIAHVIKDMSGLTFTEFISMLRIEDSEKHLLTTRKSISDIAYQYGFSDVKYYNKHFERWYHVTPGVHRKKYLEDQSRNDTLNQYVQFNLNDAADKINTFLLHAGYDVFVKAAPILINFSERIESKSELSVYRFNQATFDLTDFNALTFNRLITENAIYELKLDTILIKDVILVHSHYDHNSINGMYDMLIDMMIKNNLKIIFQINVLDRPLRKDILSEMSSLLKKLITRYGVDTISNTTIEILTDTSNNKCKNNSTELMRLVNSLINDTKLLCSIKPSEESVISNSPNHIYDTVNIFPDIIRRFLTMNNNSVNLPVKLLDSKLKGAEMFHGDLGLITNNGLKKASYYLHYLLAKVGDTLIEKSEHYIVAKGKTAYQILIFNFPGGTSNLMPSGNDKNGNSCVRNNIVINFRNNNSYQIIRYTLNSESGSVYNSWSNYGSPDFLTLEEERILDRISFPKAEFSYINSDQNTLEVKLDPYSVQLLEIKKVIPQSLKIK